MFNKIREEKPLENEVCRLLIIIDAPTVKEKMRSDRAAG